MRARMRRAVTETEKKSEREYLKDEVKKLEDNEEVAARETEENQLGDDKDDDSDGEEDIPGGVSWITSRHVT